MGLVGFELTIFWLRARCIKPNYATDPFLYFHYKKWNGTGGTRTHDVYISG